MVNKRTLLPFAALLLLAAFTQVGCSKNDCQECALVTESSFDEALNKCQGWANSHPRFKVVQTVNLRELCGDEIQEVKRSGETSVTTQLCPGVSYTIRTRLQCR